MLSFKKRFKEIQLCYSVSVKESKMNCCFKSGKTGKFLAKIGNIFGMNDVVITHCV